MNVVDRKVFGFRDRVRKHFSFLEKLGFVETGSSSTMVRYEKGHVEVEVYHDRLSYEVGVDISISGQKYSLAEIIRLYSPDDGKKFRYPMSSDPEKITKSIGQMSLLLRRFGSEALKGEPGLIKKLLKQRKHWSEEYALDVLEEQLRPEANAAFQRGDYSTAVDLYSRIRNRLSPAEIKKLDYAIRQTGRESDERA